MPRTGRRHPKGAGGLFWKAGVIGGVVLLSHLLRDLQIDLELKYVAIFVSVLLCALVVRGGAGAWLPTAAVPPPQAADTNAAEAPRRPATRPWMLFGSGILGLVVALVHAVVSLPQWETWPRGKYVALTACVGGLVAVVVRYGAVNAGCSERQF